MFIFLIVLMGLQVNVFVRTHQPEQFKYVHIIV